MENGHPPPLDASEPAPSTTIVAPASVSSPEESVSGSANGCRTVVISDIPLTVIAEDSFGPHSRIAKAILRLIKDHQGAISIGLEGSWGSGKTTIVKLLSDELKKENKKQPDGKKFALIAFDAWAHEGDPLRRTFLETLIHQLKEAQWVDKTIWDKHLEDIAKQREIQKTITPPLTRLGKVVGILFFFIPLGTAIVGGVIEKNIEFSIYPVFTSSAITNTLLLYLGVLFAMAPLLLIMGVLLRNRFSSKKPAPEPEKNPTSESEARVSTVPPTKEQRESRGLESANGQLKIGGGTDLWSLLFSKTTEESVETITTPNPTSLEFESYFNKLMDEALAAPEHNIVFVLDNLDRVSINDALSVWSTLQIFLKHSHFDKKLWYSKITVLVLYDPKGISSLWDRNKTSELEAEENGRDGVTPFFLDKSFQVRFEVPSPVLSDWYRYLMERLKEAFPEHDDTEFHTVYQVMSLDSAQRGEIPTIRELKLYVNQIGAFHRQWEEDKEQHATIKLSHIAYFVLLRRKGINILNELKADNPKIPSTEFVHLLGPNLQESLAALAFDVEKSKALQLLLGGRINKALAIGDADELKKLSKYEGFWQVLENVIKADWLIGDVNRIPIVAKCLRSDVLDGQRREATNIINILAESARRKGFWDLLDPIKVEGISALCHLKRDKGLIEFILKEAVQDLIKNGKEGKSIDVKRWANHQRELCNDFYDGKIPDSIIALIKSRFDALEMEDNELSILLEILIECDRVGLGLDASKLLRDLVKTGKVLSHLQAKENRGPRCKAWCLFTLLCYRPEFITFHTEHLKQAEKYMQQPALADDEPLMNELTGLITRYSVGYSIGIEPFSLLFNTFDVIPVSPSLRKACLKHVLDGGSPEGLFTKNIINEHWSVISSDLLENDEYPSSLNRLVKRLIEKEGLVESICSKGFDPAKADFYELVVKNGGLDRSGFLAWCLAPLQALTQDEWLHHLQTYSGVVRLVLELHRRSVELSLGRAYEDALLLFCKMMGSGKQQNFPEAYRLLPQLVTGDGRNQLRSMINNYFEETS